MGADWILRLASGPENASQLVTMRADGPTLQDAVPSRPVPSRCEHAYLIYLGDVYLTGRYFQCRPSISNKRYMNYLPHMILRSSLSSRPGLHEKVPMDITILLRQTSTRPSKQSKTQAFQSCRSRQGCMSIPVVYDIIHKVSGAFRKDHK